jgi:hypothetical protein
LGRASTIVKKKKKKKKKKKNLLHSDRRGVAPLVLDRDATKPKKK